ncbi:MAG: GNAT family N-acetyltransferase [Bdellovibrionales bacterium]|nr:GNAT family N-acetyltransferase [Bdellovibrionales bacterium]
MIESKDNLGAQVRKAELGDLHSISEVNLKAFGNSSHPYSLRQNFDLFHETYFVAVIDNKVIGFCLAAIKPRTPESWILNIGIVPELQRKGIGTLLLRRAFKELQERGATTVSLTVDPKKASTQALYARLGFEVVGEETTYYGKDKHRLVMRARLAALQQ